MRNWRMLAVLTTLAEMGCLGRGARITTGDLGRKLGISQQSASRLLREAEERGFVERSPAPRGFVVRLTGRGEEELRRLMVELERILGKDKGVLVLRGKVFTGMGEGRFYVSLKGYRRGFMEKLGFDPYPGTLNVRLDPRSIPARRKLELMPGILIPGFSNGSRTYGSVTAFKALVNGRIEGAVLLIERTHYGPDVVEVISPKNLRKVLSLRDGDVVWIDVLLT